MCICAYIYLKLRRLEYNLLKATIFSPDRVTGKSIESYRNGNGDLNHYNIQ